MRKKLLSLAMALVITAGVLTGCGDSEPGNSTASVASAAADSKSTENSETKTDAEVPEEIVNITVFTRGLNENVREQEIIDAMNEYSAEKIGVTITFKPIASGEYKDTITRNLAAKDDVDVFFMASYTSLVDLARGGALMDITDYVHSPEYADLYAVMPEYIWEGSAIDGQFYCIPNYKESAVGFCIMTPAALADTIKEKYGIDFNALEVDSIWNFENYEEYIDAAMKEGVSMPCLKNLMYLGNFLNCDDRYEWVGGAPIMYNKETKEISLVYENEDFMPWFTLLKSWNDKGFYPEEILLDDFSPNNYLKSGDYGITGWTTVPDNQNAANERYGMDVYLNEIGGRYITSTSVLGSTWAIAAYSQKADAALKWIQLLETDTDFADLFVYGIEGTDYTRNQDGAIEKIADSGWAGSTWMVTSFETASVLSTSASDFKEQYIEFNDSAKLSELAGFRPVYDKVQAEYAAVQAVQKEVQSLYNWGFYGPEQLADTVAQFKAAGVDTLMNELQAQLDEYLAN